MILKSISIFLVISGLAILVFGGGAPIGGVKNNKKLSLQYKEARKSGKNPSSDEQGAFYTEVCYKIGAILVIFSIAFYFMHVFFEYHYE